MAKKEHRIERPQRPPVAGSVHDRPKKRASYDLGKPERPSMAKPRSDPSPASPLVHAVTPMKKKTAPSKKNAPTKAIKTAAPKAPPKRVPKPVPKALATAKPKPAAKAPAPVPKKTPLPEKLAAFSEKILEEEEQPVAVRSWSEAKQGIDKSKEYLPKTGAVTPVEDDEDEDGVGEEGPGEPTGEPHLEPLTGPMAVPKDRHDEFTFRQRGKLKRGRKDETTEDFGPVELRQATASGGKRLTTALPENLQRGAARIKPLTSPESFSAPKVDPQRKKEAMRLAPAAPPSSSDLMDFGEVQIAQQTRSGARKVGTLDQPPDDESPKRKKSK